MINSGPGLMPCPALLALGWPVTEQCASTWLASEKCSHSCLTFKTYYGCISIVSVVSIFYLFMLFVSLLAYNWQWLTQLNANSHSLYWQVYSVLEVSGFCACITATGCQMCYICNLACMGYVWNSSLETIFAQMQVGKVMVRHFKKHIFEWGDL